MTGSELSKLLSQKTLIGDGAMGTMLYSQGVFINTCYDETNLTSPDMVRKIHAAYIQAGADFIETNTFGANEYKLGRFGLADRVEAINAEGVRIAKQASADILIAGAVGPLGVHIAPYGILDRSHAKAAFRRQLTSLIKNGVDFILLETFSNPDELILAIEATQEIADIGIVAQLTVDEQQETILGHRLGDAIPQLSRTAVTAMGLNCTLGPSEMLSSLERIGSLTDKPISIQPNAGMPKMIDGRTMYMCTPEYMAEYAKRYFEKGARIIGGCCGTTPAHIKEIAKAIHALDRAVSSALNPVIQIIESHELTNIAAKPLGEKSAFGRKLANGQKVCTIELVPPRGPDLKDVLAKAKHCVLAGIDAINVPDGPRASSRISPMITAAKIQAEAGIEAILHVCCRDRNILGMQSDLLGAHVMGLRNILAITGDPPKLGDYPEATAVFDLDSIGMTRLLNNLNKGRDLGAKAFSPAPEFTIGVGVNPAGSDIKREIERFRAKVEAGAEYAITQPVFDIDCLRRFCDAVANLEIPIIAGIWPFTSYKNAEFMANEVPGVTVPAAILERMSRATTKLDGIQTGIEIAQEMIRGISDRVGGFAISAPFGNISIALTVMGKGQATL